MAIAILTTYAARFASMIAFVLLLPIVMTAFGAEAYGLYALTVSLAALFQQDLGVGDATTRFTAIAALHGDTKRMRRVAAASGRFYLAMAAIMGAATAVTFGAVLPHTRSVPASLTETGAVLAVLGVTNIVLLLGFSSHRQVLAGVGRLDEVNYLLIGQAVLRIALTIVVCVLGLGIVAVAIVDTVATLAFGVATWLRRRRRAPEVSGSFRDFDRGVFRELFSMSTQLMVLGIASVVIMQIGGVLTALLLPIAATTLYAAGQRVYLLVKEVTASLSTAILPTASRRHAGDGDRTNGELYVQGTALANMLMTLVLVPTVVFMPVVIGAWLGPDGGGAAIVAQVLVLSLFANNNHLLAVPILTAEGAIRRYAVLHVVWAVSGSLLALWWGGMWGLGGIALGLVLPVVVLEPVYVAVALRRLRVTAREFVLRCLVAPFASVALPAAGLAVSASVWHPDLPLAVAMSACWAAVAVTIYVFFGIDRETRRRVSRWIHERRRPVVPAGGAE